MPHVDGKILTVAEVVREALYERMKAASKTLGKAVRPIYRVKNGKPDHLGTCIFLKRAGRHLLMTAAHVTDQSESYDLHVAVVDYRFAANNLDRYQQLAKELVRLRPDLLLAYATPIAVTLQRETRTIPIVFVNVSDPVGSGLVASLAQPNGNLTGLMLYEEGAQRDYAGSFACCTLSPTLRGPHTIIL